MRVAARSLGAALGAILGPDGLRDDPEALAAAAVDDRVPRWIARPATLADAARVLALAHDESLAVLPRGSGSALGLGHPPARLDLVLDLTRLDAVLEHQPEDLTVTVQAGVTAGALAARLAPYRQRLPLDPPGAARRTLGGLVATAASGPLRLRHGAPRDLLLGVRFIQADGVLTWGGARVVKSVTGYDVPKLLTGSLGTLGVLGELTFRLHPLPEFEATSLVAFARAEAAQDFLAALVDSPIQPSRVEWLNARALAACGLPVAPAALAVAIGSVEAAVEEQVRALRALAAPRRGVVESMGVAFWATYDRALERAGPVVLRVATLAGRLASTVAEIEQALDGAVVAGAAPLGLLRAACAPEVEPAARAIERLRAALAEGDGSVIVERAPRPLRERLDPWGPVAEGALALMRGLKREFDPRGVLNPGRFVGGL